MEVGEYIRAMGARARAAAAELAKRTTAEKNAALLKMADALEADRAAIQEANARDIANAKAAGISAAMVDRLTLTDSRFRSMVDGVRTVLPNRAADPDFAAALREAASAGVAVLPLPCQGNVIN